MTRPYRLREGIDPDAARHLGEACGVSASVAQILLHRGIRDPEKANDFLHPRLAGLTDPASMADRDQAAERIARALAAKEKIAVFGDYDVDGTTSAAIVGTVLEALGGDVAILVANRFSGGYGFSADALERVRQTGATLLITCDCGSSDHPRIADAAKHGIDTVVVDHHLVPDEPLPAVAFLNPHRPDCGFPYKGLASAGLALSLAAAVRAAANAELDIRPWLDLVALGTVADVAPLDGDNRKLVRAGLMRLAAPRGRPGVVALRESAGIRSGACVGGVDISFRLAPRLNAAGRLGDPTITLELLRAMDLQSARQIAVEIERINKERREIERRITEEAIAQARELYGDDVEGGVVVAGEGWHRGVVGITAARLVDRFDAPAIVIAMDDGVGHGSARTPEGFPLYDAISEARERLIKFGGHQAAAGLTIAQDQLEGFRADFDDACRTIRAGLPELDLTPRVDVVLGDAFQLPSARELALLEPVGEANSEPLFLIEGAEVEECFVVGNHHLKLWLRVGKRRVPAFGFEQGVFAERVGATVDVLGSLRPDGYRGGDAVELRLNRLL